MRSVEWPPGSGKYARYNDEESAFLNEFVRQQERGEISYADMWKQITTFHEMKVVFPHLDIAKGGVAD